MDTEATLKKEKIPQDSLEVVEANLDKMQAIFILSLGFMFLSLYVGKFSAKAYFNLIFALLAEALAVVFYFLGKKHVKLRLVNPVLNGVAVGFAIQIYFVHFGAQPTFADKVYCSTAIIVTCFIMLILHKLYKCRVWIPIAAGVVAVGCVVYSAVQFKAGPVYPLILFCALFSLSLIIGDLCYVVEKRKFWTNISAAYMFISALILFVALLIISEGDVADGLDFDFGIIADEDKKAKRRQRRQQRRLDKN